MFFQKKNSVASKAQDPKSNTHEIGESWVIPKSWLVNNEIFSKKYVGLDVILFQVITEVIKLFFEDFFFVIPKAQDPWTNTHVIDESRVIPKSWHVNAEIFVKKIVGLYVMLSQLITEVLIHFFQKKISVAPKAQIH